ncbi:MAG TPA: hypothetical protein PLQ13_10265 [Candidatus Krumholzibacteria bacterium]|nr:hypothetical protein [Candidatus Krumholzibacteria bacterium]
MIKRLLRPGLVLAVSLLPVLAAAQTPFAQQNLGQRVNADDARMVARGFGLTESDSLHPGFKNVASLSSLRHVAVKFTGFGESADHEDATGTRHTSTTYSPDVRVALPVAKGRLAVTAGFSIFRSSSFQTRIDTTWNAFGEVIEGGHRFEREGSLFTVPLGVAWEPIGGLALGGSYNLVHGAITDLVWDEFDTPLYQWNALSRENRFSGTSVTASVLLKPGRRLRLAASYTPAYDIDVENEQYLQGVVERSTSTWRLSMPAEYQAGAEMRLFGRWRVGGDVMLAESSKLEGNAEWSAAARDEFAWSAGLERVQAHERRAGLGNLPLRVGAAYRRWSYDVGGAPVDEWTYSAGTGFPFRSNLGQLDVALSWSRIGDLQTNGRESTLWRLTVSVTGLEAWW